MNLLEKQRWVRCKRKRTFRNPGSADEAAQRASIRTGELIISYQCCECLKWHIGRADRSQILAHAPPGTSTCVICTQPIRPERIKKAKKKGIHITTCCQWCQQELESRTARQSQPTALPTNPAVPKGPEKPTL